MTRSLTRSNGLSYGSVGFAKEEPTCRENAVQSDALPSCLGSPVIRTLKYANPLHCPQSSHPSLEVSHRFSAVEASSGVDDSHRSRSGLSCGPGSCGTRNRIPVGIGFHLFGGGDFHLPGETRRNRNEDLLYNHAVAIKIDRFVDEVQMYPVEQFCVNDTAGSRPWQIAPAVPTAPKNRRIATGPLSLHSK